MFGPLYGTHPEKVRSVLVTLELKLLSDDLYHTVSYTYCCIMRVRACRAVHGQMSLALIEYDLSRLSRI